MEPFKNLFSRQLVSSMASHLSKQISEFDKAGFENPILEHLEDLELKDRAQLFADHIHRVLPINPEKRARIMLSILSPNEPDASNDNSNEAGMAGWGILPLTMVVGQHGISDFDRSLILLKEMTKRFSSEFGIRYFLLADQDRVLETLKTWITNSNPHVRRLISEGTRPRLPWAMQLPELIKDPSPMIPILKALRDDQEEYVRRSVANHLNDIAKDHPDLVAEIANNWMVDADKNRKKMLRHACRSLIKNGHKKALTAFGINAPKIIFKDFTIETPKVLYGDVLSFKAILKSTSNSEQSLIIDYLVHFRKANGKLASKTFKGAKVNLMPHEVYTFKRTHSIRPITTRKYYPGLHGLSLRINGEDHGYIEFNLIM